MRKRRDITVPAHPNGTRSYSSGLVKRIFAGTIAMAIVLFFLGGVLFINLLSSKVSGLHEQINILKAEHRALLHEKQQLVLEKAALTDSIARKTHGLDMLGEELDNIEALVGLKPSPDKNLRERIDSIGQTALEKKMMLDSIPSGYPVESRTVTSRYGMRIHPVHGGSAFHGGIDLRSARGAPVYATADAIVEYAGWHRESGLGKMIMLIHNYGFSTTYGHLDKIMVSPGDFVKKGDVIGLVGNTGISTAPHLHYEIHCLKRRYDPAPFMDWSIEQYDPIFESVERIKWQQIVEGIRSNINVASTGFSPEIHLEIPYPLDGVRPKTRAYRQVQETQ